MQSQLQQLMVAVLTIQAALKFIHGKTRNSCLRCSSTGVDISMSHYRYAWQDSDIVIFVPYSVDRGHHLLPSLRHEGIPPHAITSLRGHIGHQDVI